MSPREIVKQFVSRWPDEKLAAVFAFNEDGKMNFMKCGLCLLGIDNDCALGSSSSDQYYAKKNKFGMVEDAYQQLAVTPRIPCTMKVMTLRQRERDHSFGEILSEVMAESEALRKSIELSPVDVEELEESLVRDMEAV